MHYSVLKSQLSRHLIICLMALGYPLSSYTQVPQITTRFANPSYNLNTEQYCVDVEFLSDTSAIQVFGMNVRFFYDDTHLEMIGFSDFQGGYEAVHPNPPYVATSSAGPALFQFSGAADYVNGAMQLMDQNVTPIILDTVIWSKIFQICFLIDDPNPDPQNFCPSLVWDMEENPENGGFLVADDGVVITYLDPDPNMESGPTFEEVVQHNWMYSGPGTAPWGQPIENACISLSDPMPLEITGPANMSIQCNESSDPSNTGSATANDECNGSPTLSFTDVTENGCCPNNYIITRTWTAENGCDESATCTQLISVVDSAPPIIVVPSNSIISELMNENVEVVYTSQIDIIEALNLLDGNSIEITDNCNEANTALFNLAITPALNCVDDNYFEQRIYSWITTDDSGNSASLTLQVKIMDNRPPVIIGVPEDIKINCEPLPPVPPVEAKDDFTPVSLTFNENIDQGDGAGLYTVDREWIAKDACGNFTIANQRILWFPESINTCEIIIPSHVRCKSNAVPIASLITGSLNGVTIFWTVQGENAYIQTGQGTPNIRIHIGETKVIITLTLTDAHGCIATAIQDLYCNTSNRIFISAASLDAIEEPSVNSFPVLQIEFEEQISDNQMNLITVWPNPASTSLNVSLETATEQTVCFTGFNFTGQTVLSEQITGLKGQNNYTLDVSQLPQGNYLLQVKTLKDIQTKIISIFRGE